VSSLLRIAVAAPVPSSTVSLSRRSSDPLTSPWMLHSLVSGLSARLHSGQRRMIPEPARTSRMVAWVVMLRPPAALSVSSYSCFCCVGVESSCSKSLFFVGVICVVSSKVYCGMLRHVLM